MFPTVDLPIEVVLIIFAACSSVDLHSLSLVNRDISHASDETRRKIYVLSLPPFNIQKQDKRQLWFNIQKPHTSELKGLDLSANQIGDSGMIDFVRAFAIGSVANLTQLNLASNNISTVGAIAFANAIKPTAQNPTGAMGALECINLNDNTIGSEGLQTIASAISNGSMANLEWFFLNNNQISDSGIIAIAEALKSPMRSMVAHRGLYLANNLIGDDGVVEISHSIAKGSLRNLNFLDLSSNKIGDRGMVALSNALAIGNGSLHLLDLENNQIGDLGIIEFSNSIVCWPTRSLTVIDLDNNQIGDLGMIAVSHAIPYLTLHALDTVYLSRNPGDIAPVKKAIAHRLSSIRSISSQTFR